MTNPFSWLDLKLGLRMLAKHPALTLVGGIGLAVAVAVSVGFFSFMSAYIYPTLPLDEGERVVALENRDLTVDNEERQSLHDFVTWREELRTVEDVAAFSRSSRNLITGEGVPELIQVAEMTAAGFRVARVPPLMGRYLLDADEAPGAPPVLVIGHEVWQERFGGAPDIVGRGVQLGGTAHTIVGVMPEGFAFPESHQYWTALGTETSAYARRDGPSIYIFGRLAPGITIQEAQAELDAIGRRATAAFPETHAQIRPMVMPYTHSLSDVQGATIWQGVRLQLMVSLLLVVVALNVAILVYARTARRHGEIAVRSALGASRARVVAQLFVEALVLSSVAAVAGLLIAQFGLDLGNRIMELEWDVGAPFWMDYGLRPATVLLTVGLALFAAVIIGVLPGLQATGKRLQADLRQLGGGTGIRLGRTWTVLVVAQVAIAVAALPAAIGMAVTEISRAATRPTFAGERVLVVGVGPGDQDPAADDGAAAARAARFGAQVSELILRLESDPAVAAVTYQASLEGRHGRLEVEGVPAPPESPRGHLVASNGYRPGFEEVFDVRVLAGRTLEPADLAETSSVVVVSESFVEQVLDGEPALGRRVRHAPPAARAGAEPAEPGPWYQIVGVIEDAYENPIDPALVRPGLVYPVAPAQLDYASLRVRLRGDVPADFGERLRETAASVDPAMRVGTVRSMADANAQQQVAAKLVGLAVGLILISVLLLSAAGVYALMSFTVTQRRREIGIRTALGAHPGQVLRSVFARAAAQIALGLVIGAAAAMALERVTGGELMSGKGELILPALALLVATVGLLAALGPARRGLRIQPTEALRAEA